MGSLKLKGQEELAGGFPVGGDRLCTLVGSPEAALESGDQCGKVAYTLNGDRLHRNHLSWGQKSR